MKEIGDYFGLHYSRVNRIIAKANDTTCPPLVSRRKPE